MKKSFIFLALSILTILNANAQDFQHVDSKTFSELANSGRGIILDVRTPQEYSRGHIEGSTLISINDSKVIEKISLLQKEKPIYVYCLTGSRSRSVANYLSKNGFSKVYNLQRGIMEWQRFGYPIIQSNAPIANNSRAFNESEFNSLISSKELVLIDFHATWCAPCKKMSPIIDKLQEAYAGKAIVSKIDVEANKSLKNSYEVQSVPGLILFNNGKEVWRHTGIISYDDLSSVINQYL